MMAPGSDHLLTLALINGALIMREMSSHHLYENLRNGAPLVVPPWKDFGHRP